MRFFYLFISFFTLISAAHTQEEWTIRQCIDHALENNLDLAIQDLNNDLTDLQVKQSKMNFGPNINAQADYTQAFGRSIDITTNSYSNQNVLTNRYFLSGAIDLFNGLQRWNALKRSKLQALTGDLNRQIIEENIQLDILTTYLTILKAREQAQQARLQKENTSVQYDRSKALVDAGVLAANDIITLEAQLANDESLITTFENQEQIALTNLKLILRLDPAREISVVMPDLPELEAMQRTLDPLTDIYGYSVEHRPEIKTAEKAEEIADYDIKLARSSYYPTLSLFGSVSTNYSDQYQDFRTVIDTFPVGYVASDPSEVVMGFIPFTVGSDVKYGRQLNNNLSYAFGLTLSIPIYNKGATQIAVQQSMILADQSRLNTEKSKQQLFNTLQQAYANALAAIEQYRVASVNQETALRSVESEKNKLETGVGTNLEFNNASNNWAIAASRLIEAKYDYIFNIKYLDFFQGKPIEF